MGQDRKNILLISFDDALAYQHYKTVFGAELQTPNLDRFAERAVNFQAAYCQAPVCGPSRASFMTARSPHETGVLDNYVQAFDIIPPRQVWSVRLREQGYFCSSGGKVHHRYRPVRRKWHVQIYDDIQKRFGDDMSLPKGAARQRFEGHRGGWATTDPKDDESYFDHKAATSAVEFLESYDGDGPFYREVGFFSPHGPHYTPARFKAQYDIDAFRRPAAWEAGFDAHGWSDASWPQNDKIREGDFDWWRCSVRNYFAALSHGDYHFGRVMDALAASRFADNTIVVVLSDHGFHLGNRNRYRKTTLWEQVACVPLMIHDPDRPGRMDIHDPVALLDVGPTVLDYAGLPPPRACLGTSLRPLMDGASDPDRGIPTFYYNNAAIRKGDHRIIRYEDGSTQLFDLRDDFWQLNDLGRDDPAFAPMYAALVETCRDHGLMLPARPG